MPQSGVLMRRWLPRGETLVASAGLSLAGVLTAVLVGAGAWALRVERETQVASANERLRSVARTLARSVEDMLSNERVAVARSTVAEALSVEGLSACRVVLPGGRVLIDGAGAVKSERGLPASWPTGEIPALNAGAGTVGERVAITIAGHGPAVLDVELRVPARGLADSRLALGLGVAGAAGLFGSLVAYRSMRRRVRGIGAVGEALRALGAGEKSPGALAVSPSFGAEAAAWNRLLEERESLRRGVLADELGKAFAGREGGGGSSELSAACDALWLGLILVDDRAQVKYINGAGAAMLSVARECVGEDFAKVAPDVKLVEAVRAASGGHSRQRASVEVKSVGDRSSTLRFTVRAMRKEESVAAMVLVEDVTQQRVADESRNSFVAQVTHELRTPLTNIRLYLDTLVEDGAEDAAVRAKCINVIAQEARRLERVVSDMLSVSEIEAGSFQIHAADVRLDALFEEIAADYKAQATDKEITLKLDLPPKLPVITGDRDKIALALHNLVGNALKYTPLGGQVTVKVEESPGQVTVHVSDNGIGIKGEECELIFDKFYRAKDKRIAGITGSGLGLALARQVVRLHGGDITVRSQIDKGSTFTLTLPAAPGAALARAA